MRENLTLEQMKANRKLWVEALRSGKYKQTREKLKARNGAMCCLGVLTDIAAVEWKWNAFWGEYNAGGETDIAPPEASDFVGLCFQDGGFNDGRLTALNDEGKSFAEIADIIESEPDGLFVSEVQP